MKKLLVLLLIFGIFACSCASTSDVTIQNKAPNELPEHQEGYIAYVINKETGTYHLPSCSFAQKMDEEKKDYVTKELELDYAMDQKFYEENLEQIKIMMRVINELFGAGSSKYEDIIPTETTGYYNN